MKKIVATMLTGIVGLAMNAQTVVRVTADGVNVRQNPSTTAQKLMYDYTEDCYDCYIQLNWGTPKVAPGYVRAVYHPATYDPFELTKTTDGWGCIAIPRPEGGRVEGWVSSKYLEELVPAKPSLEEYARVKANERGLNADIYHGNGNFRGLILECVDEMEDTWALRVFNGGTVFSSDEYGLDLQYNPDIKGVKVSTPEEGFVEISYGPDRAVNPDGYEVFDINKCTSTEINAIKGAFMPDDCFKYRIDYFVAPDNPGEDYFYTKYLQLKRATHVPWGAQFFGNNR